MDLAKRALEEVAKYSGGVAPRALLFQWAEGALFDSDYAKTRSFMSGLLEQGYLTLEVRDNMKVYVLTEKGTEIL